MIGENISVIISFGSVFVNIGMNWFNSLNKPQQWIPDFVIPVVWTVIYLLFFIILSKLFNKNKLKKPTIILLVINGIINVLWCLIFFTLNH